VGIEGLLVASGHLRHGILLAPVTARLVVQLLRGEPPEQDLSAFDPLRLLRKDGTSTGGRGKSVGSPLRPAR
jgi:glycine/D-amino acid oxidase-like deaminating enzyme